MLTGTCPEHVRKVKFRQKILAVGVPRAAWMGFLRQEFEVQIKKDYMQLLIVPQKKTWRRPA
jgi:hypothetical protein